MSPDVDCVASFLELCRTEHFGRAAARLHITTSALTKRIQRLERQVGEELLERGADGFAGLTEAGRRFLPAAEQFVAAAAMMTTRPQPKTRQNEPRRTVRLGVPGMPQEYFSPAIWQMLVDRFTLECPETRLVIVGIPFPRLLECIGDDDVDVLLDTIDPKDSGQVIVPFVSLPRMFIVPTEHWEGSVGADGQPVVTVDEALRQPLLTSASVGKWADPWVLNDVEKPSGKKLVDVEISTHIDVLNNAKNHRICTMHFAFMRDKLGPGLIGADLIGAPPVTLRAACSASALRRPEVEILIRVLRVLVGALTLPAAL